MPEDIWFVADGIESDNAEWASNGLCIWSASLEEDDFLLSDPAKGKRIEEVGAGSARYHYLSCNVQGVFLSPTYPAMPRLAFAKGSLTPRAGGSLSPTFVNQQDIAGIQFQPFGGIVMMEFQDFDYE